MDTDDGGRGGGSSSSEDESSADDEEMVPIELTDDLRRILEQDYYMVKEKGKVMKVPAEPNVVGILEMYWRHYVTNRLCGVNDKPNTRNRQPCTQQRTKPEDLQKK